MPFLNASKCEDELRRLTNNKIIFEMVNLVHVELSGLNLFPIPGPFNRLCTTPGSVLDVISIALVDKLQLGVLLDPKHPEVEKYGEKLAKHFPAVNNYVLTDLDVLRQLKKDAFDLKKYQSEHSAKTKELLRKHLQLFNWVKETQVHEPNLLPMTFRRIVLVKAFPCVSSNDSFYSSLTLVSSSLLKCYTPCSAAEISVTTGSFPTLSRISGLGQKEWTRTATSSSAMRSMRDSIPTTVLRIICCRFLPKSISCLTIFSSIPVLFSRSCSSFLPPL